MKKYFYLLLSLVFSYSLVSAQNPVIKDIGMSDPHVRVFNDTIYLFCGHDSSPDDKIWTMKDWRVFSSSDLTNWNFEYNLMEDLVNLRMA
jgi:arabinoxylan arabinofuranohydrolase